MGSVLFKNILMGIDMPGMHAEIISILLQFLLSKLLDFAILNSKILVITVFC